MLKLPESLKAWGNEDFENVFKHEVQAFNQNQLPLQAGLSQSSYVSDSDIKIIIITVEDTPAELRVKTGVFYSGVIAGSCCADDPTSLCEQNEYCELIFNIDKTTALVTVALS